MLGIQYYAAVAYAVGRRPFAQQSKITRRNEATEKITTCINIFYKLFIIIT